MKLLIIHVHKDSANVIPKEVTRAVAESMASLFRIQVETTTGFVEWQEFLDSEVAAKTKAAADAQAATDEQARKDASASKLAGEAKAAEKKAQEDAQKAIDEQQAVVLGSLLKRQDMSKTAFKKLDAATREKMLTDESALMAAEAAAGEPAAVNQAPDA